VEDKNQNIEELFRDTFSDYEESVRPDLWNQISGSLDAAGVSGSGSTVSGGTGQVASFITSAAAKWVAIAAIVAITGSAAFYLYSGKQSSEKSETNNPQNEQPSGTVAQPENESAPVQINTDDNFSVSNEEPVTSSTISKIIDSESVNPSLSSSSSSDKEVSNAPSELTTPAPKTGILKNESGVSRPATASQNPASIKANEPSPVVSTPLKIQADKVTGKAPLTVEFRVSDISYSVDWNFGDGSSQRNSSIIRHTFENPGEYEVTAKAAEQNGGRIEKIKIKVTENIDIQNIPNIFTPNGDGINDRFRFSSDQFAEIEVIIIDQNGGKAARITDTDSGWDGTLKSGAEAQDGTYLYTIFATSHSGQKIQQKGWVRLVRKK